MPIKSMYNYLKINYLTLIFNDCAKSKYSDKYLQLCHRRDILVKNIEYIVNYEI